MDPDVASVPQKMELEEGRTLHEQEAVVVPVKPLEADSKTRGEATSEREPSLPERDSQPSDTARATETSATEVSGGNEELMHLPSGEVELEGASERSLQQWLAMKEKEVGKMVAQLALVEACRQQQAEDFAAEIEQLKKQHSEEVERALTESAQAHEKLKKLEVQYREQVEQAVAERDMNHDDEIQALRAELEQRSDLDTAQGSLIPQFGPQLSPRAQKELKLQRERLQRQHRSELKTQESRLRSELALESETAQSRLEEEFTGKLAEAVTESALKNAMQVEQVSNQLRLEKQRAVDQLEQEQEERHMREAARLAEERKEAVEACKAQFESAVSEYQSRIAALETALAESEHERQRETGLLAGKEEEWVQREERLRGEMQSESNERIEEVRQDCVREKEAALAGLREAMEGRLQLELRRAHKLHKQEMIDQQVQLQTDLDKELATAEEKVKTLESELQILRQQEEARLVEARAEAVRERAGEFEEVSEKMQAVHRAELVAVETERETERGRHREEVERIREEMETRLHQELEQVSVSEPFIGVPLVCVCVCVCVCVFVCAYS